MHTIIKHAFLVIILAIGTTSANHQADYHELSHRDLISLLKDKEKEINSLHWELRAAKVGWGALGLLVGCGTMIIKHHLDHVK